MTIIFSKITGGAGNNLAVTLNAGAARVLCVVLSNDVNDGAASLTFAGEALTKQIAANEVDHLAELWTLLNPSNETGNLTYTGIGSGNVYMHALQYNGVSQVRAPVGNSNSLASISVARTIDTDELIVGGMLHGAGAQAGTPIGTTVERADVLSSGRRLAGEASGSGSVSFGWSFSGAARNAIVAAVLEPTLEAGGRPIFW